MNEIRIANFPLSAETDFIIKLALEVHKTLGKGFLEVVYKDALEFEFLSNEVYFVREKEFCIVYKMKLLKHKFYTDFVVFGNIVLEVKAKETICNEDLAQTINYLKCSGCKIGLILNFGQSKLQIKRVAL